MNIFILLIGITTGSLITFIFLTKNFGDIYDKKMCEIVTLQRENEDFRRQLMIKNEYLKLINDLGYDYDGFNTVDSLKGLIDELCELAKKGIKSDDKYAVYEGSSCKKLNILQEEIQEVKDDTTNKRN